MAAGKFPASPTAKINLAKINKVTLVLIINAVLSTFAKASFEPSKLMIHSPVITPEVAIPQNACKQAPTDQIPIAHMNPFLVSNQSTNFPAKNILTA